jgi:regulator of sirC expression with transglutaminase-like and TPR domain
VSPSKEIEQLQADADYYHDRIALLRAKLYRWGLEPSARLHELERRLEDAEERLRDESSHPHW